MFAGYKFESSSSGMGIRGGEADNLEKRGCNKEMEEKSEAAPLKKQAPKGAPRAKSPLTCRNQQSVMESS